jgi:molecular chaperone GrpE
MDEGRFVSEPENPGDGAGSVAPSPQETQHPAFGEGAPAPAPSGGARVVDKRHAAKASVPVDLEGELVRARAEAAEHLDDLRRLKAEFENYRKRVLREQTALVERAAEQLVERLLPVLDNFELALIAADETTNFEKLVHGVEMVFGELMDLMRREGLQKIDALGKPFDPMLHEAVLEVGGGPAEGDPFVGEVVRNGYTLKDKVVRPAMVKVVRR